jgi:hypothetical protein
VNNEGIEVDLIVMGQDPIDFQPLEEFVSGCRTGYLIRIPKLRGYLSDSIQQILLNHGYGQPARPAGGGVDDDTRRAIEQSLHDVEDAELQAAMAQSLVDFVGQRQEEEDMDEELAAAIAFSRQDFASPGGGNDRKTNTGNK